MNKLNSTKWHSLPVLKIVAVLVWIAGTFWLLLNLLFDPFQPIEVAAFFVLPPMIAVLAVLFATPIPQLRIRMIVPTMVITFCFYVVHLLMHVFAHTLPINS